MYLFISSHKLYISFKTMNNWVKFDYTIHVFVLQIEFLPLYFVLN